MKTLTSFAAFALFFAAPILSASAQAPNTADFHAEMMRTYDFTPHSLTKEQRSAKSAEMDAYWTKAKADHATYIAGLRRELVVIDNPPFFLFDGSELLLSLSSTPEDQKIVAAAVSHTDLRDVDPTEYLRLVNRVAAQGDDTTAAALHILDDPTFKTFIAQHYLKLGQDYSLVFMLYPTDQTFWLDAAIARLTTEKDDTALKSLLLVVWYAQTDASDAAVSAFAADASKSQVSRAAAQTLIDKGKSVRAAKGANASQSALDALRLKRSDRMKAISDEALDDFEDYTKKIVAIRKAHATQIT